MLPTCFFQKHTSPPEMLIRTPVKHTFPIVLCVPPGLSRQDFGDFRSSVVWQFFTLRDHGDLHVTIKEGKQLGTRGGGWVCSYVCNTFLMSHQSYGLLPQFLATLVFCMCESPTDLCPRIEQSGEWQLYLDSVQPRTQQFDILGWWEGMCERLPLLCKCARRTLAIPHTSCDVDRSFSMWKRVHSEKQHTSTIAHDWASDECNPFSQLFLTMRVCIVGGW